MKLYTITRRHDLEVLATGLTFMEAYGSELDKLPRGADYLIHFDGEPAQKPYAPQCAVQAAWAYL